MACAKDLAAPPFGRIGAEAILEAAHHRHGQARELHRTDQRHDVEVHIRLVALERRAFEIGRLAAFEPKPSRRGDGRALAVGGVDARFDMRGDEGVMGVGVTFARERLDMPLSTLVAIIDDPGFLHLAGGAPPTALPDRHVSLLSCAMSEHQIT